MEAFISFSLLIILFIQSCHSLSKQNQSITLEVNSDKCLMSLYDVQESLKKNPYNIESVDDGFFPVNSQPSFWIKVKYYFNTTTLFHDHITVHPAAFEAAIQQNVIYTPDFTFQWVRSPIFHYFNPAAFELFGGVIFSLTPTEINIVIDPICDDDFHEKKSWIILNKLTMKLKQFSSHPNTDYIGDGFVTFLSKDHTTINLKVSKNNTIKDDHLYTNIIIILVITAQYTFSLSWMILIPVFLQKFQLLPTTRLQDVTTDAGQLKCSLFIGFTLVTCLSLVFLYLYDLLLFIAGSSSSLIVSAVLFFPFPSIPLAIWDLHFACKCCATTKNFPMYKLKTHKERKALKCFMCLNVLASVILTLFLQDLSFHIGWLVLLLVEYPSKVGVLCVNFLGIYISASLFVSGIIKGLTACTASRKAKSKELISGSFFLFGITCITLAYYITITMVGSGYHDGLSAIMPSLIPILFFGFLTWIFGGFRSKMPGAERESKILEVMLQQATNGIGTYYQDEFKDLPV